VEIPIYLDAISITPSNSALIRWPVSEVNRNDQNLQ